MHAQEFKTLGFTTDQPKALLAQAVATGNVRGMQKVPGFDLIGAYNDDSGARLSLVRRKGHDVEVGAALASSEGHRAAVYRISDKLAHASLVLEEDESLELMVQVDDPTQYPERSEKDPGGFAIIQSLTLGAIAVRVDVYPDEATFQASRPDEDREWSSQSLASPSIAAEGILGDAEINARAYAGFVVEGAWKRKNALTGREFWYGVGRSRVSLAFALPGDVELQPGNVVLGTFVLTASSGLWDRT